ncbi:MAG: PSD1 and planctomycete cytochrome C domain-containing protein [Planctomycetota bacterium]
MKPAGLLKFLTCFSIVAATGFSSAQETIDYTTQIKPIFSDNCYACHGPDEGTRAAGLRLDIEEEAADVIAAGDSSNSELVTRILSGDPDEQMPPAEHRKKLTDEQKQLIVDWIDQGAQWSGHWAFEAVQTSESPAVEQTGWPRNYVDNYILSVLEQKNLSPSPPADAHTLLRRLSYDLTGLPPTPTELSDFGDGNDRAYEAAVDRLLESPHFGERMAVYWLDLVRYADSVGYHGDQPISVTPYRDYVIEAFNSNMPFDQFTREQLAGDLLESPTHEQLIASGYNRLGMMSAEGGVQPQEYLAKYAADRVRTTASVWLGVTLGCAECHDHKFDPFTTQEFYEFAAFFADIKERGLYSGANTSGDWGPRIDVPDEELPALLIPIDEQIAALQQQLIETPEIADNRRAWENKLRTSTNEWQSLSPVTFEAVYDVDATILDDDSVLVSGVTPDEECYVITAELPSTRIRGIRLEALPDDSLLHRGPGRANNGNFVVTELIAVRGELTEQMDELKKVFDLWPEELKSRAIPLENASATIEQTQSGERHPDKKWSAASAIDHDANGPTWGWAILPDAGKPTELVVQIPDAAELEEKITFVLQQYHGNGNHTLGRFRLSVTEDQDAKSDPYASLTPEVREAVLIEEGDRTPEQAAAISAYYISIAPELAETNAALKQHQELRQQTVEAHTRTSLITEGVPPRVIRVLARGDWMDKSGQIARPGVPASLGGSLPESDTLTRRDLADWIVSPDNPVTARVFVNRIWRLYFGNGLSAVLDDLGSQGEPPVNPELLDRLADEFINSGWNVKQLIRSLVMSQTYRQSSAYRVDLTEIDPENRLLARQSRFRMDAEFIRDHALMVGDLLNFEIGGRSAKPYQPPGLYRHLNFPRRTYEASDGDAQYRRGVYTHWQRQYLHPAMKTFDAPAREECTAARPRSSTPLAALVMLNDPSYVEAARSLASAAIENRADTADRMKWIFLRTFSRQPDAAEIEILLALLDAHREYFEAHPDEAVSLINTGQSVVEDIESPAELAAWTSVCRAILNMHEFVLRK